MNKTPSEDSQNCDDELLPEYRLNYQDAKVNRFAAAAQSQQGLTIVVLDKDVAQVFTTPEAVNKALREVIRAGRIS